MTVDSEQRTRLIELTDVSMRWDHRMVLSNVSMTVRRGDFIAITGPNGGGKTTLLRIILKLLRPTTGTVTYYTPDDMVGDATSTAPSHDRHQSRQRLAIGYLPQKNMIDSHFPISVHEVVASGLLATSGLSRTEAQQRAKETIELMGLQDKTSSPIGQLSGGQLQRALLGRAIISRPELLVLDEPLSYIDKRFESQLYHIIDHLAKETTILLVSHEMSTIAAMANRHFIVDGGIHECSASHHYVHSECDE